MSITVPGTRTAVAAFAPGRCGILDGRSGLKRTGGGGRAAQSAEEWPGAARVRVALWAHTDRDAERIDDGPGQQIARTCSNWRGWRMAVPARTPRPAIAGTRPSGSTGAPPICRGPTSRSSTSRAPGPGAVAISGGATSPTKISATWTSAGRVQGPTADSQLYGAGSGDRGKDANFRGCDLRLANLGGAYLEGECCRQYRSPNPRIGMLPTPESSRWKTGMIGRAMSNGKTAGSGR